MSLFFRALILLSCATVAAAAVVPLTRPVSFDLPLGGPMPTWFLGCLLLIAATAIGAVASMGLLLLRRWGRSLGVVAIIAAAPGILATIQSPMANLVGSISGGLLMAGVFAWCFGIGLAFHPSLASHLKT